MTSSTTLTVAASALPPRDFQPGPCRGEGRGQHQIGAARKPPAAAIPTGETGAPNLPTWMRQPGESYSDWNRRNLADKEIAAEAKLNQPPMKLDPLYSGSLGFTDGCGSYDGNGNSRGSRWW